MAIGIEYMLGVRERFIYGTALNFIAVAFGQGTTLIANIIIAHVLLKQSFGEYFMVQSTLLTMATLAQLATGYTVSKYVAEYRSIFPARAARIMGVCKVVSFFGASIATFLLVVIASWLSTTVLKAPHLGNGLIIGAAFLFFSTINGYQTGALAGLEAYSILAKAGILSGTTAVIAISIGAWTGGINGALMGLSISALIRCLIHNMWLRLESRVQQIRPCYLQLNQEKEVITRFALPAAIAGYFSMPMIWLANSFLVRQPGGYGEMALYASSYSVRMLVLFIPQVINTVSLSILNNIKGCGDQQRYKRLFWENVLIIFFVTTTVGSLLGFFGDTILSIFGKDFSIGKPVLQALMISTIFEGISIALYQHIQVQGKMWTSFLLVSIPRETLFIIVVFFLVPLQGAVGLSIAYTLSWILASIIISFLIYHEKVKIRIGT